MDKKIKIVLVDDNEDYLFTMKTFLERNGFEALSATNEQDGVELIQKEHPDIVLLDVMMESLFSGFEVCRAIRTNPDTEEIPIIGISAMGEALNIEFDQWRDYQYFSPNEFVEKPVDKENLLSVIKEVLQKAKKDQKRPKWKKDLDESYKKGQY
ncbi:MAG: response regulator [Deltaproteobacteria bacterium]|nr:response regulator [Deltaproteobacteria bacterium]